MASHSSGAFSMALFRTATASSTASHAVASGRSSAVNQVEKGINKMKLKDPDDRSSVSHTWNERPTADPRQTNQNPSGLRYFSNHQKVSAPYRGLLNEGATCYLNATLQVLFMTEVFRDRVLLQGIPDDTSEKLVSALKELFKKLKRQDGGTQRISTIGIIKALGIERAYEQQDAVEYFLDILEKVGPNLAEVFSGTMRNKRVCSENHESHDDSSFKSIQIALNSRDGPYSVEDGVRSYFKLKKLDGDNQMYCDICEMKSDTSWSYEIHEYPTILALHLQRFVYDYWSCRFVKNDCPMDIPLHLPPKGQEYWLYAVINHRGSRYGGHYTTDIRSSAENKWYCFDDSRVTETDESKLKRSSEAYLLLYQKMDSPPGYETRKETLNSHTDLTDPRTEHLLPSVTEQQRSTGPFGRVEDVKEEPKMQAAEAGEPVEASRAECGRAHNKPQLEVSAVTGRLRILVLGRPKSDKNTLAEMIMSEVGFSSESQLQHGKTIKDSLEMCSPGPHMVLWVAPLGNNKKDIEAFEEIYRFLGSTASKYIMIVFTSKGHPKESVRNATRKYKGIKNNHVLDISADLHIQVKELVTKLRKTVDQNHKKNRPYYDKKPRKRKHKKTKNTHKRERASKKTL